MGFIDWIKNAASKVWNGIKAGVTGAGRWVGGALGINRGDPNSQDVNERIAAAGAKSANILGDFIPTAIDAAKNDNLQGVLGAGLDALHRL